MLVGIALSGLDTLSAWDISLDGGVVESGSRGAADGPTWMPWRSFERGEVYDLRLAVTDGLTDATRLAFVTYTPASRRCCRRSGDTGRMQSDAATVDDYLGSSLRIVARPSRPCATWSTPTDGYEEMMAFGMIGWGIPLSVYPDTYNKQPLGVVALASQKNHMALYLMGVYTVPGLEDWLRRQYDDRGLKLTWASRACGSGARATAARRDRRGRRQGHARGLHRGLRVGPGRHREGPLTLAVGATRRRCR